MKKMRFKKAPKSDITTNDELSYLESDQVAAHSQSSSASLKASKPTLSKALIAAIVGLLLLIGIIVYLNYNSATSPDTALSQPSVSSENNSATKTSPSSTSDTTLNDDVNETQKNDKAAAVDEDEIEETATIAKSASNLANIPVPQDILAAPIPESNPLVKEEIQRLSDQEDRLKEQEALLSEQVTMMQEINQKKAEQIKLLSKQIDIIQTSPKEK